jgi:hypothetical protein
MVPATDRDEQITRFYLRHADRLRRSIAQKTRGLDHAIIDDACGFTWELLCRRPDIDLDRHKAYCGCARSRCAGHGRWDAHGAASSPSAA